MERQPHGMMRRGLLGGAIMAAADLTVSRATAAGSAPPPFYSLVGQFVLLRPPLRAPSHPIGTAGGSLIDFAALAGRVVIVNFWATWCAPCVSEMPALDRLAASLRGAPVEVLPIAMDASGKAGVAAFYAKYDLTHLPVYVDSDQQVGHLGHGGQWDDLFPLVALPTTFLIDPHGYVVGYVPGAAQWDSTQAKGLIAWVAAQ
jgi:thiol-disulfide isomerase/thioredoxin